MINYQLKIKRVYDPEDKEADGVRILVDRLWPRGESKAKADLFEWEKVIAPTNELRKAFHDGTISFKDFAEKYLSELNANPEAAGFAGEVKKLLNDSNVTFLYASKNREENNAVVLRDWIKKQFNENN